MHKKFLGKSLFTLTILATFLVALIFGQVVYAQNNSLVNLYRPTEAVVNGGFISPLVELFGNVSVGKQIFIASNTVVRSDPKSRVCIGNQTNLQDNIVLLALQNQKWE